MSDNILHSTEHKTHDFLAEELLVPNLNKSSANRINMFCSNIMQAVVLKNGQKPRVFTNFENQIGEISYAYRKLDRDYTIIDIIDKDDTKMNRVIIMIDSDSNLDMINIQDCHNITEEYGFVYINYLTDAVIGDVLPKDTVVYHSTAYDQSLNLSYGTNLRAVYFPMLGVTYEDGIVISETAASKLTHYTVTEVMVSVNTNNILLNLYGDESHYKCLPDIGSYTKDGIVCGRRVIDYNTMMRTMTTDALMTLDETDTCFYASGQVVDIQVFCNKEKEILAKNEYNSQILDILADQEIYQERMFELINKLKDQGVTLSDELSYQYSRLKDIIEDGKKYVSDNSAFDNLVIKIKIKEEHAAKIGSKVTNR